MKPDQHVGAIVIGTGQSGGPLAGALADAGRRTVIIERALVGGTCINYGCTPTKTMVASARIAHLARRAPEYGHPIGPVRTDLARVRARKDGIVEQFRQGSRKRLEDRENLTLVEGPARFVGERAVEVDVPEWGPTRWNAEQVFINTGTRPRIPVLEGSEEVPLLDSTSIMELTEIPEHLIVIGGGYVGLEFAQMFRRFGCRVTIVHRGSQLLNREDADVAGEVAEILRREGIRVLLETEPQRLEPGAGALRVHLAGAAAGEVLEGSHILAAIGRVPNTDDLDLAAAGVQTDPRGYIATNDRLETSAPGIYAMGDVKGGPAFTHISYDDFRILRANLLEDGDASTAGRLVPYVVFIDPQLGRVGLTEREARQAGRDFRVAKLPMSSVARAIETGETEGFMKVLVDAETDQILGCAMLGIEGGEIMSAIEIAMLGGLHYTALRDGVFAHPTLTESLNNLFGTLS